MPIPTFEIPQTMEEAKERFEQLDYDVKDIQVQIASAGAKNRIGVHDLSKEDYASWIHRALRAQLLKTTERDFLKKWIKENQLMPNSSTKAKVSTTPNSKLVYEMETEIILSLWKLGKSLMQGEHPGFPGWVTLDKAQEYLRQKNIDEAI
jgi:hypothetical protein